MNDDYDPQGELPRIPPKHLPNGCYARADALEVHMDAARAEGALLRQQLSLAEDGLASYEQDNRWLRARLERIEQARFTWAMACECYCAACTGLDKLIRVAEPQPAPHDAQHNK